jgi:uncharacterized protein
MTEPDVLFDPSASRFTFEDDGHVAELQGGLAGRRFVIVHTRVPDEMEGRGVGGRLVRAAVDHAVADDLTLVPQCPFARSWLERHPDVAGQVSIDWTPAA